jgi:chromosome segregation ATPase
MTRLGNSTASRNQAAEVPSRLVVSPIKQSKPLDIKPSDVYELKLQTQQIQQRTLVLRAQLKRTKDQIHTRTQAINKSFEQGNERPVVPATIHAMTIPNLRRHIVGARHALETLKQQIAELECDDRTSIAAEIEEELKMTYCEYQRLARGLQDKRAVIAACATHLRDAESRASSEHMLNQRAQLRSLQWENASLRSKANSYQLKIEKLQIQLQIGECQKQNRTVQEVINQTEVQQAEMNRQLAVLRGQLDQEAAAHREKVAQLLDVINVMRQKITDWLDQEPPPDIAPPTAQ